MRFGKKLAIIMDGNGSKVNQRPYISHRLLKDLLSTVVRAIKNPTEVSLIPGKLYEFKSTMEADICSISSQVLRERHEFDVEIRSLREESASLGILDSTHASDLVAAIQNSVVGEGLKTAWFSLTVEVANVAERFNQLASRIQSHLSYADINIAGFRKLLKQYEKQIPTGIRMSLVDLEKYRNIVSGVGGLVSEMANIQLQIERIMQALSPGTPRLVVLAIGSETLAAIDSTSENFPSNRAINDLGTGSTCSPTISNNGVSESKNVDLMTLIGLSEAFTNDTQSRVLSL